MNKTDAIKHARNTIGELSPFGGQYIYLTYGEDHTYQSQPKGYHNAIASRSQALLNEAMFSMGKEPTQYEGGRWTDYL